MRIFIFTLLLLSHFTLSAQLKKGTFNVGVSTDAPFRVKGSTNGQGTRSYEFSFQPQFGYMFTDRWEIGAGPVLSFSGNRTRIDNSLPPYKNNFHTLGAQVFTRYYLKKEGKLIPYLVAGLQYGHTTMVNSSPPTPKYRYSFNEWQFRAGGGLNWFAGPRTALFSELTYTGTWGNGSGYTSGVNLNFGVRLFLGKKRK